MDVVNLGLQLKMGLKIFIKILMAESSMYNVDFSQY